MKKIALFLLLCLFSCVLWAQTGNAAPKEDVEEVELLKQEIAHRLELGRWDVSPLLNRVIDLYQKRYSLESSQYADCLLWCAMVCAEADDINQAEALVKESTRLFEQYGKGPFKGRDTVSEILFWDIQNAMAYSIGFEYKAVKCAEKACALKKDFFGSQSEIYLKSLLDLSKLYAERLRGKKSQEIHNWAFDSYVNLIKQEFCSRSESERTMYWDIAHKYILKTLDLAYKHNRNVCFNSMPSATFDALLLSKGLLLNTTSSFERFVNESGNEMAKKSLQYKKRLSEQAPDQNVLDSIDYSILKLLKDSCMEYQIPQLSIKWQQVQECLGEDDLAVEFFKNSVNEYGAVLLRKSWKRPRLVKLGNYVRIDNRVTMLHHALQLKVLEHYTVDDAQNLWNISKGIWCDAILKYFPFKDGKVYFSADGELLVTGIEYLPIVCPPKKKNKENDGAESDAIYCISDFYPMYRLSSMRELVLREKKQSGGTAAIYGGLEYDMSVADMLADAKHQASDKENKLDETQTRHDRGARAAERGIEYLPGTNVEANRVFSILKESETCSVEYLYTGIRGTEASFKALSGRDLRILHIATHGFFYGADDPAFKSFDLGNNPLARSGLFFSGAANKWFGDPVPDGVEDGFLTSLEVANLDFQNVDMVVLSACETGRGKVAVDGVFGLQRGFKMACANSILMSLWKVDDQATCLLMEEFYRNLMCGKGKRESLSLAKQSVRSHSEKGWDNPKYWAAFILLDGLD